MSLSPQRAQEKTDGMIEKYQDTVYRVAVALLKNTADADDVFQEVFLRYFRRQPDFQDETHEKAWFIRVTINRCKKLMTSAWYKRTEGLSPATPLSSDREAGYNEASELFAAVMTLPDLYRTVIHLYYYEGYPVREIASILRRKEATVQSQLMRGRELLRRNLEE